MCRLGAGPIPSSISWWYKTTPNASCIWPPNYTPAAGAPPPNFFDAGDFRSRFRGTPPPSTYGTAVDPNTIQAAVYDTSSNYYEQPTYTDSSGVGWPVNAGDYIRDPSATPWTSKPPLPFFNEGAAGPNSALQAPPLMPSRCRRSNQDPRPRTGQQTDSRSDRRAEVLLGA